jgi:hypothetical protein
MGFAVLALTKIMARALLFRKALLVRVQFRPVADPPISTDLPELQIPPWPPDSLARIVRIQAIST